MKRKINKIIVANTNDDEQEEHNEVDSEVENIFQEVKKAKKKRKPKLIELDDLEDVDDDGSDTHVELQEAFAEGILKPGLNIEIKPNKRYKNDVAVINKKVEEIYLELPWIERLDVISKPAPLAPELAAQLEEEQSKSFVDDDLKRESVFYRQAQSAVLESILKLKKFKIPIIRPDDYFAEMAKSDDHMQKVKESLIKKKAFVEKVEKVRQIRKQRKLQKALQAENKLNKQNAKRELMEEVKKFRKGERKDLSFLDTNTKTKQKQNEKRLQRKQTIKEGKFGMGGKKRGSKRNTRNSTNNFESDKQKTKTNFKSSKKFGKTVGRKKLKK